MSKHPRWTDDAMSPIPVGAVATYSAKAEGPVRRAELHDQAGLLLGWVWTDDRGAAGFLDNEDAGAAGVRAGAYVWALMRELYARGVPASEVLDPAIYAPAYALRA